MKIPLEAIEQDIRRLALAIVAGEIAVSHGGDLLSERIREDEAYVLAGNLVRYMLDSEAFSLLLKMVGSKRWLETWEAELYCGIEFKTLKSLMEAGAINGRKLGEGRTAPWRFCRESIDKYLSSGKISESAKIRAADLMAAGKLGGRG